MDIIRIIGLVFLLVGILLRLTIENDELHFILGVVIGIGFGLLITGKRKMKKVN